MRFAVETLEMSDGRKLYLYRFDESLVSLPKENKKPNLQESDRQEEPDDSASQTE